MKRIVVLIIISLLFFTSCGNVFVYTGAPEPESFIYPTGARSTYLLNEAFNKNGDLTVIAVYGKDYSVKAPLADVTVSINGDQRIDDIAYTFTTVGAVPLTIRYDGMSAVYSVAVIDPASGGGGDTPPDDGGDDDDNGFDIIITGP
jgi:hypothetical protein